MVWNWFPVSDAVRETGFHVLDDVLVVEKRHICEFDLLIVFSCLLETFGPVALLIRPKGSGAAAGKTKEAQPPLVHP